MVPMRPVMRGMSQQRRKVLCLAAIEPPPTAEEVRIPKDFDPFPFDYHQKLEVHIEELTNLGMGLGRVDIEVDGKSSKYVVFVPNVIPGEKVRLRRLFTLAYPIP